MSLFEDEEVLAALRQLLELISEHWTQSIVVMDSFGFLYHDKSAERPKLGGFNAMLSTAEVMVQLYDSRALPEDLEDRLCSLVLDLPESLNEERDWIVPMCDKIQSTMQQESRLHQKAIDAGVSLSVSTSYLRLDWLK